MDIARLLSGITGIKENQDVRLVELKIGQVVRGVLLKMLSDQEGMVSINGMPVRARLDTPLNPGEATWLQVQPESNGAEVVLKPLTGSGTPIADRSIAELLKWLGLSNNEQNRQLVQLMHQVGLPVDRETVQALQQSMAHKPEGIDIRQWLTAAATAHGKGIPVTGETVQALHAALFGKPAGETLQMLQQTLAGWLQRGPAQTGANPNSVQAAERLAALLDQVLRLIEGRLGTSPAADETRLPAGNVAGNAAPSAAHVPTDGRAISAPVPAGPSAVPSGAPEQPAGGGQTSAQTIASQTARPAASEGLLRDDERSPANTAAAREADASAARTGNRSGETTQAGRADAKQPAFAASRNDQPVVRGEAAPMPQSVRMPPTVSGQEAAVRGEPAAVRQEPWLITLFRDLGFEHEHRLLERATLSQTDQGLSEGMRETVKGLVLSLLNEQQLPPALKEALQQTLHTITGQQLLFAADPRVPFSVVTLTVPLPGQNDGGEAATVEIHARRNKGEPLDASNCRLLFDLNLARLGNLLMDVQVVERMVSVRILSDHPAAETLVSDGRMEAEEALAGIGYRLLSLLQASYPKASAEGKPASPADNAADAGTASASMMLGRKPYKGVDLRV